MRRLAVFHAGGVVDDDNILLASREFKGVRPHGRQAAVRLRGVLRWSMLVARRPKTQPRHAGGRILGSSTQCRLLPAPPEFPAAVSASDNNKGAYGDSGDDYAADYNACRQDADAQAGLVRDGGLVRSCRAGLGRLQVLARRSADASVKSIDTVDTVNGLQIAEVCAGSSVLGVGGGHTH